MPGQLRGLVLAVVIFVFVVISIPEVITRRGTFEPASDESAANVPQTGTTGTSLAAGSQGGYRQGGGEVTIVGSTRFPPPMPPPAFPLPAQQPVSQPVSDIIAHGSGSHVDVLIEAAIKITFVLVVAVLTALVAAMTGRVVWGLAGARTPFNADVWNDPDRTRATYGRTRRYDAGDVRRANRR